MTRRPSGNALWMDGYEAGVGAGRKMEREKNAGDGKAMKVLIEGLRRIQKELDKSMKIAEDSWRMIDELVNDYKNFYAPGRQDEDVK